MKNQNKGTNIKLTQDVEKAYSSEGILCKIKSHLRTTWSNVHRLKVVNGLI